MSESPSKPDWLVPAPYRQPRLSDDAAFFGHYAPSRARVQLLIEYSLAHQTHPFWGALAQRLTRPGAGPPWNEAVAAAQDVAADWAPESRVRRVVHSILYEGRVPGRRGEPVGPFDDMGPV